MDFKHILRYFITLLVTSVYIINTNAQTAANNDFYSIFEEQIDTFYPQINDICNGVSCSGNFTLGVVADFDTSNSDYILLGAGPFGPFTSIIYKPAKDYYGPDTIRYSICDNRIPAVCGYGYIFINVINQNDPPVAVTDTFYILEDRDSLLGVLENDYDVDNNFITILGGTDPPNGLATNFFTALYYNPDSNYFGQDTFSYQIQDNNGLTGTLVSPYTLIVINMIPVNDYPIGVNDFTTTPEETKVCFDVMANDINVDYPLDIIKMKSIQSQPKHGTATIDNTSKICYTPAFNFYGLDTLKYIICDSHLVTSPSQCNGCAIDLCTNCNLTLCDTVTFVIQVNNVNDKPVAIDDNVFTNEDTPKCFNVLSNDNDVDNSNLSLTSISNNSNHGNAVINAGQICYTPDPNYFGNDTLDYVVCDGGTPNLCDTARVIITVNPVNDKPVAVDDAVTTPEDVPVCVSVLNNDINVDDDILSLSSLSNTANNGSSTIVGNQVCYTPSPNFNGKDTIDYIVCDNATVSLCDTGRLIITVTPVNDKPIAADDAVTTNEDTPICINVLTNDADADALSLDISSINNQANNGNAGINGTQICYTPNPNYNGKDTIEYVVCDREVPKLCDTAKVVITVLSVNDKPIAGDDVATTNEDTPICVNVLNNDSDIEGNITISGLSNTANNGNSTINSTQICYTPNPNYNGKDTIEYIICDSGTPIYCDTARVIITVVPVNDKPIAVDDAISTPEDTPICINVLANDINPDADNISISGISNAPDKGSAEINANQICYTPNPNYNGKDTLEYVICDNSQPALCDTGRVVLTVTPVNDAPIAVVDNVVINEDDDTCISVLVNDTDVDGPSKVLSAISDAPNNGSISISGNTLCYTPNPDFNGKDTFAYIICDLGTPNKCDTGTVIITINPIPDNPRGQDDDLITDEDTPKCLTVTSNDSDPDKNDGIKICDVLTPPKHGTVTTSQGSNTQVCYTPDPNFNGKDTLCIIICDNTNLKDTTCLYIQVNPVPDAPIAVDDQGFTQVNTPITIPILNNDTDPDGDVITPTIISQPVNGGTATINPNGTVTYTPPVGYAGVDTFEYKICDPSNRCDQAIVVVIVGLSDTDLFAIDDRCFDVLEDTRTTLNVTANDLVKDPLNIFIRLVNIGPYAGSATITQDQKAISYLPNANFNGKDSIIYEACLVNKPNKCDRAFVCINVIPVNDVPMANKDSVYVEPNSSITIDVQLNDVDIDGKGLVTTVINDAPNHGTAVIINADSIYYTPNAGYIGYDTLQYTICEFGVAGLCDDTIVIINVGVINQPPIAQDDSLVLYNNTTKPVEVLTNDVEPDGDPVVVTVVTQPIHGTITSTENGVYTYTPQSGFNGVDSFTYQICDIKTPRLCDEATVHILVKAFVVPNIFTPNGDGIHDNFVIPGILEFPNNKLSIFNRWGDVVYESSPYQNEWDGFTVNNKLKVSDKGLPDGTYYYLLFLTPDSEPFKGFLTIKK
jgi:gliding motility-associated-like protein